jgi:hypothetical protein
MTVAVAKKVHLGLPHYFEKEHLPHFGKEAVEYLDLQSRRVQMVGLLHQKTLLLHWVVTLLLLQTRTRIWRMTRMYFGLSYLRQI